MSDESPDRSDEREEMDTIAKLIDQFHSNDVYLPSRTVYMGSTFHEGEEGGVDAAMAECVIKNLHVLETLSPTSPITIVMNNPGGDEYHGAAIYDAIKSSPCRITVVARGHAMSMGSIIMQAAAERVMGANAIQMIHYGTWGVNHHSKTAWKIAIEGKRWDEWMESLYLDRIREKHPAYTIDELRKLLDHDTYLTAQQSVDLGLADRIG